MLASVTSHKREGDDLGKQEETRMRKQEKPKKNRTRKEENERETTQRSQGTQKRLQIITFKGTNLVENWSNIKILIYTHQLILHFSM